MGSRSIKQCSASLPDKTALRPQSAKAKSSWSRSENGKDLAPILQKHARQVAACKQENNNPNDYDRNVLRQASAIEYAKKDRAGKFVSRASIRRPNAIHLPCSHKVDCEAPHRLLIVDQPVALRSSLERSDRKTVSIWLPRSKSSIRPLSIFYYLKEFFSRIFLALKICYSRAFFNEERPPNLSHSISLPILKIF